MNTREITKKLSGNSNYDKKPTEFTLGKGYRPEKNTSNINNEPVDPSYVETRGLRHDPQLKYDSPLGYHYEVEARDNNNSLNTEHTASGTRVTLSTRK